MSGFLQFLRRSALQINALALFGAFLITLFFFPHVYHATIFNFSLWYSAKLDLGSAMYGLYYLIVPSSAAFIGVDIWLFGKATFIELERAYRLWTALLYVAVFFAWVAGIVCAVAAADLNAAGVCFAICLMLTAVALKLVQVLSEID